MAIPPNITALFSGKALIVNEQPGRNISPVLTGVVHLPIKHSNTFFFNNNNNNNNYYYYYYYYYYYSIVTSTN